MESTNVVLRPNWNLLDSTFESYKLSLQQLPIYAIDTGCKPDSVTLSPDEFSYNRTKAISLHNHLFGDPWNDRTCYFVDETGNIRCTSVIVETSLSAPHAVFQLGSHSLRAGRHTPVTLSFPSPTLCLISDGAGLVYLLDTGDRKGDGSKETKWKILLNEEIVGGSSSPIILLHSRQYFKKCVSEAGDSTDKEVIGIVSLRFEDEKKGDSISTLAVVDWSCLVKDATRYQVDEHRTFKGKQSPFYATLSENGAEIFLGSHSQLNFISDWDQQALNEEMDVDVTEQENTDQSPLYSWTQSAEDVTVFVSLPEGMDKNAVLYQLSKTDINVGFKDSEGTITTILDGKLFDEADTESSNWSVADKTLEITIQKQQTQHLWPCVVVGDSRGQVLLKNTEDDSNVEMPEVEARGMQPPGLDHYEDCDDLPDVNSMLYCFNSTSNKFTHESGVASNQWLFNCYHNNKFCTVLRHDIDALVWESSTPSESSTSPWTHVATFNALGYVRASKEDIKYGGCSPNASYSALCESNRRVFVYHSPTTTAAPLRNRSTGKQMHVSKQQVVTLPSSDPIIGFHTTTELMFILTEQKIFVIKVNAPDT